jgi:hypothetical protein
LTPTNNILDIWKRRDLHQQPKTLAQQKSCSRKKEKAGIDLIIFLLSIIEFSLEDMLSISNKWSILSLES